MAQSFLQPLEGFQAVEAEREYRMHYRKRAQGSPNPDYQS
jgi:hypothetical protein